MSQANRSAQEAKGKFTMRGQYVLIDNQAARGLWVILDNELKRLNGVNSTEIKDTTGS